MTLFHRLAPILLLAAACGPACADLIMPGSKGVKHEILVEGSEAYPDLVFVAYPVSFQADGTWQEIRPGTPLTVYKQLRPAIYALRGVRPPKDRAEADAFFKDPTLPRSEVTMSVISTIDMHDPTARIRTVYRITGLEGTRIQVVQGADERFDADGDPLSETKAATLTVARKGGTLAGVVGLGVLGIVLLRRRRARKAAEARS